MKKNFIIILLFTINLFINGQEINLEIDNPYISLDEWTTLTVNITGDVNNIRYTEPDGVTLTSYGQSTSYSFVNGKNSKTQSISFRVKPLQKGTMKLPVFYGVNSSGDKITSEEVKIYVEEGNSQSNNNNRSTDGDVKKENVKLYINLPDRNMYIGESIPVEIEVYFLNKYQPERKRDPYVKSGSFTLELSKNIISNNPHAIIGGDSYHQVVWQGYLTPLKAGNNELELQMESYIKIPEGGTGFFSSYRTEEIITKSKKESISILSLPTDNQPKNFSGAIGEFTMSSSINMNDLSVGDPITLTIDIFGKGNFSRIDVPRITKDVDKWKFYPESSTFQGSTYKGLKKFQQILSPLTHKTSVLPAFEFSYFNPETAEYVILETKEHQLNVSPGNESENKAKSISDTSFNPERTYLLHRSSKPVNDFLPLTSSYLFRIFIFLIIVILVLTIYLFLKTVMINKNINSDSLYIKKQIKAINQMEDQKNYRNALLGYKDLIIWKESSVSDVNPMSITSEDLKQKPKFYRVLRKIEEMQYLNCELEKEEYINLTENIIKEIK